MDYIHPSIIYNKYATKITCAFKSNVIVKDDGSITLNASRTKDREKFIFNGFLEDDSDNICLIECPDDLIAIEFEENSTNKMQKACSIKKFRDEWIEQTYKNCQELKLEACICDHGGTSRYLYIFNIKGLPDDNILECKKIITKKIVPHDAILFIDWTNLGRTLIPVINRPHWKPKYNGAIHQIIQGVQPHMQNNDVSHILVDEAIHSKKHLISDNDLINEIKNKITLKSLLIEYGYDISHNPTMCKLGHESHSGKCFSFDLNKGLWNCFHCSNGGDIIEFIKHHDHVDFLEAQTRLMRKAGISINHNTCTLNASLMQMLAMKKKTEATEVLAQFILAKEHIFTTRNDEKAEMWIYKDGIYKPEAATYIKEECRNTLKSLYTTGLTHDVLSKIEVETYINQENLFITENPYLIACENGIINLKTKELLAFSPNYKFFNKIPIFYDQNVDCPKIKKFFNEVLSSEADVKVMQEIFGFCLLRQYKFEKAFMFTGEGRNGKSKSLELLRRFLGVENCANISLQDIEKDSFALGELFNKLACISADISDQAIIGSGNFKSLTGNDLISAARKFLTRVNFVNYAKMLFSANKIPIAHDATFAFFNRWIILEFKNTYLLPNEFAKIPPTEHHLYKQADINLIDKLHTPEEMSGLLNWALEGLNRILYNNNFSISSSTEEVKTTWVRKANSFQAFIFDYVDEDYDGQITKADMRKFYSAYCRKHKLTSSSDKTIKYTLETQLGVTDKYIMIDGERDWAWIGLKFKEKIFKDFTNVFTDVHNNKTSHFPDKNSKLIK